MSKRILELKKYKDKVKLERDAKKLEAKLNAMSPEKREEFLAKLTHKLNIIDAKIKDIEYKQGVLDARKLSRDLTEDQVNALVLTSAIVGAAGLGITVGCLSECLLAGVVYAVSGGLLGAITSFITGPAIEAKIFSNNIAKFQKKANENKKEKLEKQAELLESKKEYYS